MGIQIDEFKGIRARRETVAQTSERWVLSSCLQQKTPRCQHTLCKLWHLTSRWKALSRQRASCRFLKD